MVDVAFHDSKFKKPTVGGQIFYQIRLTVMTDDSALESSCDDSVSLSEFSLMTIKLFIAS